MSNAINWDLLGKLCRGRSLADVQTELESFYALRTADQEKAKEVIHEVFRASSKLSHLRKPDLMAVVVRRMAGDSMDPALIDALQERCAAVIDQDFKIERKSGVVNPHYVEPAPSSRELAQGGAVR
jgi:hypothetical protein